MWNAMQIVRCDGELGFGKFFDQKLGDIFLCLPRTSEDNQFLTAFEIVYEIQMIFSVQKLFHAVKSRVTRNGGIYQADIFCQRRRFDGLMKKPINVILQLFCKPFSVVLEEDLMLVKQCGNDVKFCSSIFQGA